MKIFKLCFTETLYGACCPTDLSARMGVFSVYPSALQIFSLFNIMFVVLFGNQGCGDQISEEGGRNEVQPSRLKNQQAHCADSGVAHEGTHPLGRSRDSLEWRWQLDRAGAALKSLCPWLWVRNIGQRPPEGRGRTSLGPQASSSLGSFRCHHASHPPLIVISSSTHSLLCPLREYMETSTFKGSTKRPHISGGPFRGLQTFFSQSRTPFINFVEFSCKFLGKARVLLLTKKAQMLLF